MLKRVRIEEIGDADLLPGKLVEKFDLKEINDKIREKGLEEATATQVMLELLKLLWLPTRFYLRFIQETTKVLTEAAIHGKVDPLIGLKENVIIGKLIQQERE